MRVIQVSNSLRGVFEFDYFSIDDASDGLSVLLWISFILQLVQKKIRIVFIDVAGTTDFG
jgi:hypothetical protein